MDTGCFDGAQAPRQLKRLDWARTKWTAPDPVWEAEQATEVHKLLLVDWYLWNKKGNFNLSSSHKE